jgi:MFS family permease
MNPRYQPSAASVSTAPTHQDQKKSRLVLAIVAGVFAQGLGAFAATLALGLSLTYLNVSPQEFAESPTFQAANLLGLFVFQFPAGYLAASLASKRPLLAAAIVSLLVPVVLSFVAINSGQFGMSNFIALLVAVCAPISGAFLWRRLHRAS